MANESIYIVVDFDGTVTTHDYPIIGKDIGAVPVLKKLVASGHKLILFTMRSSHKGSTSLSDAVKWFIDNDIPLYGIQSNPTQKHWTSSPKAYGNLIIDDASLGCPLKFDETLSNRPFVDWNVVESILFHQGLIKFAPMIEPKDVDFLNIVVTKYNPDKHV